MLCSLFQIGIYWIRKLCVLTMKIGNIIQKAVVFIAVAALVVLVVLAVVLYDEYKGGMQYVWISFLLAYIGAGLVGVLTRFWWIVVAAVDVFIFTAVGRDIDWFLACLLLILTAISLFIGCCASVPRKKLYSWFKRIRSQK